MCVWGGGEVGGGGGWGGAEGGRCENLTQRFSNGSMDTVGFGL